MTNLKPVQVGANRFCGPAVLSILTGKNTDECAKVISKINGQYNVTGVLLGDLLIAADRLGFDSKEVISFGSLYRVLVDLAAKRRSGMYILQVAKTNSHFICVEVKETEIYICDNHTKEPINASSSSRLMQPCLACYQVIERVKSEDEIAQDMIEAAKLELEKKRKLFESDVYQIAFEVIKYSKEISKAIGDISIDEANDAVIKHFTEKIRSYK